MPVRVTIAIGTNPAEIRAAVLGLAAISLAQMQASPLPRLYSGQIRYVREPANRERWQTARETSERGAGDCEDLAAYRVAELHLLGEPGATIAVRVINPELYHIVVRRKDGSMEDPSSQLGMRGKA